MRIEYILHTKYTYFLRFEIGHDKYADAYEIASRKIILAIHSFNIAIDQSPSFLRTSYSEKITLT